MKMINVLFVSIAFPPKFDSESLQIERIFSEMLSRPQFCFGVVTARTSDIRSMPVMEGMKDFSNQISNFIALPVSDNRWVNRLLAFVGLSQLPDSKRSFHRTPLTAFSRIQRPDVVYSRAFPPSSSILACRLAEYFDVPWVMHLSDPWFLSPIAKYSAIERHYNQTWELRCLQRASYVSFTTERTLDLYVRHYPQFIKKFFIARNSVECNGAVKSITSTVLKNRRKLKIVHTGLLNEHRSPVLVVDAMKFLARRRPDIAKQISITFAGPCDCYVNRLFAENRGLVSYVGTVSYKDACSLIVDSDLVLSIDINFLEDSHAVFMPSKLLDYGALRKKVLAITNSDSPTASFVSETGGVVFRHNEVQSLADYLVKAYEAKETENVDFFFVKPLPEQYKTPVVVDTILDKIHASLK